MAFKIKVENKFKEDKRDVWVDGIPITPGDGSREFDLEVKQIKISVDPEPGDSTRQHWFKFPVTADFEFKSRNHQDMTIVPHDGQVTLKIPPGQTPNWELIVSVPTVDIGDSFSESESSATPLTGPNDNVTVGDNDPQ